MVPEISDSGSFHGATDMEHKGAVVNGYETALDLTQDDTPLQSRHAAALGRSCMVRGGQLTRGKAETLKLESGITERRASRAAAISRLEGQSRSAVTTADYILM